MLSFIPGEKENSAALSNGEDVVDFPVYSQKSGRFLLAYLMIKNEITVEEAFVLSGDALLLSLKKEEETKVVQEQWEPPRPSLDLGELMFQSKREGIFEEMLALSEVLGDPDYEEYE